MNAYMNQYQNNQVTTASPEQVLIMLYDGAIRFVRQAKQAIVDGKQAEKAAAIGKVIAIVTEFSNTLDYEVGGEIALDLSRLYDFMIRELSAVNARGSLERLEPVEKILLELRGAFAEAVEINKRQSVVQDSSTSSAGNHTQRAAAAF
jgi:flagellar protein FliS